MVAVPMSGMGRTANGTTRLQIAAYIGRSLTSRAIQIMTRAGFNGPSHVAIRDTVTGLVYEAWDAHGVRIIPHLGCDHTPGTRVDLYDWPLTTVDQERVLEFCRAQVGRGYDYLGILGFVTKRPRDAADKWFCSELVTAAARLTANPIIVRTNPRNVAPVHVCWSPTLHYHGSVQTRADGTDLLPYRLPTY